MFTSVNFFFIKRATNYLKIREYCSVFEEHCNATIDVNLGTY